MLQQHVVVGLRSRLSFDLNAVKAAIEFALSGFFVPVSIRLGLAR